jgi:hypothetical protein
MEQGILLRAIGPIPFATFLLPVEMAELLRIDEREANRIIMRHEIAAVWISGERRILTEVISDN